VAGYFKFSKHRLFPAGIASWTIAPDSNNATWRVLRIGAGKVKSLSGRWSDFSSVDVIPLVTGNAAASDAAGQSAAAADLSDAAAAAVPSKTAVAPLRVYYGVQWSQREVDCGSSVTAATEGGSSSSSSGVGELEYEPVCAMPAPWIGQLDAL
jgi:hypothetical protein